MSNPDPDPDPDPDPTLNPNPPNPNPTLLNPNLITQLVLRHDAPIKKKGVVGLKQNATMAMGGVQGEYREEYTEQKQVICLKSVSSMCLPIKTMPNLYCS